MDIESISNAIDYYYQHHNYSIKPQLITLLEQVMDIDELTDYLYKQIVESFYDLLNFKNIDKLLIKVFFLSIGHNEIKANLIISSLELVSYDHRLIDLLLLPNNIPRDVTIYLSTLEENQLLLPENISYAINSSEHIYLLANGIHQLKKSSLLYNEFFLQCIMHSPENAYHLGFGFAILNKNDLLIPIAIEVLLEFKYCAEYVAFGLAKAKKNNLLDEDLNYYVIADYTAENCQSLYDVKKIDFSKKWLNQETKNIQETNQALTDKFTQLNHHETGIIKNILEFNSPSHLKFFEYQTKLKKQKKNLELLTNL
ncbi:hypothetical protein L3V83_08955 [Thiotrichales bacterium 19X7-9]|nr:hypothetical protein [Thiotrichales bacterium 19X7-9]